MDEVSGAGVLWQGLLGIEVLEETLFLNCKYII